MRVLFSRFRNTVFGWDLAVAYGTIATLAWLTLVAFSRGMGFDKN